MSRPSMICGTKCSGLRLATVTVAPLARSAATCTAVSPPEARHGAEARRRKRPEAVVIPRPGAGGTLARLQDQWLRSELKNGPGCGEACWPPPLRLRSGAHRNSARTPVSLLVCRRCRVFRVRPASTRWRGSRSPRSRIRRRQAPLDTARPEWSRRRIQPMRPRSS